MRAPLLVRRPPDPKVHKRSGPRGQLVLVRELARAGKGEPQYRAERSAPDLNTRILARLGHTPSEEALLAGRATYEATGDTIEEAVDAVCEVGR